jgi:hypothetical protein
MTKVFVLYNNSGIHSGRALGNELANLSRGRNNLQIDKGRPDRLRQLIAAKEKFDVIVNVGCSEQVLDSKKTLIINDPEAIARSVHKLRARKLFKEKNVPAPELWLSPEDITKEAFPVVARTSYHTKGRGFWFCKNKKDAVAAKEAGATHFLKFIQNTREFRIHVRAPQMSLTTVEADDYLTLKISEKLPSEEGGNQSQVVKNHDNGWVFSYPKDAKTNKHITTAKDVAKQTVKELGLHYGAVDILISRDTNRVYVLEVNTSPCLTDETSDTLEKYSEGVLSLLNLVPQAAVVAKAPPIVVPVAPAPVTMRPLYAPPRAPSAIQQKVILKPKKKKVKKVLGKKKTLKKLVARVR